MSVLNALLKTLLDPGISLGQSERCGSACVISRLNSALPDGTKSSG